MQQQDGSYSKMGQKVKDHKARIVHQGSPPNPPWSLSGCYVGSVN